MKVIASTRYIYINTLTFLPKLEPFKIDVMYVAMLRSFFLLVFYCAVNTTVSLDWNYADKGPEIWEEIQGECGKDSQSPIDIRTACATYRSFAKFQLSPGYSQLINFTLINDGWTIDVNPPVHQNSPSLALSGGGLNGTFQFINLHLHWGENRRAGSEHRM